MSYTSLASALLEVRARRSETPFLAITCCMGLHSSEEMETEERRYKRAMGDEGSQLGLMARVAVTAQ